MVQLLKCANCSSPVKESDLYCQSCGAGVLSRHTSEPDSSNFFHIPEIDASIGAAIGIAFADTLENFITNANPFPAIVEEPAKQFGLIYLALIAPAMLSGKKQAIRLGAIAGLTFGILESIRDWMIFGFNWQLFAGRLFLSVPGHVLWSAVVAIGTAIVAKNLIRNANQKRDIRAFLRTSLTSGAYAFLLYGIFMHSLWGHYSKCHCRLHTPCDQPCSILGDLSENTRRSQCRSFKIL